MSDLVNFKVNPLFEIGGLPISSSMLSGFLLSALLSIFFILYSKHIKTTEVPGRVQSFIEMIYEYILSTVEAITASKKVAIQVIPIIIALIIYLGFSNVFSLVPFLGAMTYTGESLFRTSTSDLNVTLGIGITVVLWTHFSSIKKFNLIGHFSKFFKFGNIVKGFKQGIGSGFLSIIDFFIGLLDIISEFAKIISISLRLFGNMFAGEILAALILKLSIVVLPVFIMLMSVFTGFLQAFIFGALAASYFGAALKDES